MSPERDAQPGEAGPRPFCYGCDKPSGMCLCGQIRAVDNRTAVFVLQHPRERTHPIGTARLARLGLRNVRVEVAWNAGAREQVPPQWLPPDTALLYPTRDAQDLTELPRAMRPRHLLVLDGTWNTARSLYRDKLWLRSLPHVQFVPAAESRYRLRKQPAAACVSTIEAIVEALRILEPDTAGLPGLLDGFDAMIEAQLAHVERRAGRPHVRKRRPENQRRIPHALVAELSRLVVVHAESARERRDEPRALVQVTAIALGSGALFQQQLRAEAGPPAAHLLDYMQLCASDFEAAVTLAELRVRFRAFLAAAAPAPTVAAWNQSTIDLLQHAGLDVPAPLALKSAYRARCGTQHKTLEDVVAAKQLLVAQHALRGRAAQRLACAAAVARHLHYLAASDSRAGVGAAASRNDASTAQ